MRRQLQELARELGSDQLHTQLVVTLDASSRVREGERAQLWFDPAKAYVFDPATGENLTIRNAEPAPGLASDGSAGAGADRASSVDLKRREHSERMQ